MRPWSLALRLAVLVTVLGLLQAVGVLAFSYAAFDRELGQQRRVMLEDKISQARHLIGSLRDEAGIRDNAFRLNELIVGHAELHLAVARLDALEPVVGFSREAAESLRRLREDTWGTDAFLNWQASGSGAPMLSLAGTGETMTKQLYEIVVTADRTEDRRALQGLLLTSLTWAPFGIAIVFASAYGIVRLGLRPLRKLQKSASRVSASALAEHIDPAGLAPELRSTAEAFNAMLDRLEDGVRRLSEFSGDLAHEMRTPLATLLGRTQVSLSRSRSSDELAKVLEDNVEELQRLSRLVSDMLFLAQADNAQAALDPLELDLAEEARKVAEFLELLAEERGVRIEVDGAASVVADRSLVRRAITNLVSNAIRHSAGGSIVRIQVRVADDGAAVDVLNTGDSIPEAHLARLFDRFYRVDRARAREEGGTGLGLAIVQAIMTLHQGHVEVASHPSGETRFTMSFKSRPESATRA